MSVGSGRPWPKAASTPAVITRKQRATLRFPTICLFSFLSEHAYCQNITQVGKHVDSSKQCVEEFVSKESIDENTSAHSRSHSLSRGLAGFVCSSRPASRCFQGHRTLHKIRVSDSDARRSP